MPSGSKKGYSRPAGDGFGASSGAKHLPGLRIEFQEHAVVKVDGALRVAFA